MKQRLTPSTILVSTLAALALGVFGPAACKSGSSSPDGGPVCIQGSTTCTGDTACTNGVCAATCDGGTGCGAGQYCESPASPLGVCSADQTPTCASDGDCPPPQTCSGASGNFRGVCTSIEARADGGTLGCLIGATDDACSPDAICYQIYNSTEEAYYNYCLGLAHCGADGSCPTSADGAVCNELPDGGFIFPNKERLCLLGFCTAQANCASGTACFFANPALSEGQCQLGEAGDYCYTNSDCFNSTTGCELTDGGVDDGGALGTCY